ncbi:MAG: hypothetical protein OEW90_03890 [Betaproteobacteria bacterium]|nr:hypothetical protein [Betaproteobacteria bacterium]MDH4323260.1 hypothetical protein [Betaproteobacteria bacterium]
MRKTQKGLGWFGSLIVLALAVGAGYYLYQEMVVGDAAPSCAAEQNECLQKCRRASTDNASMQACQEGCRREADVCAALKKN